eukprot:COSAG01_NODE_8502_length_2761_cov_11.025175_1_plen_97_part_00
MITGLTDWHAVQIDHTSPLGKEHAEDYWVSVAEVHICGPPCAEEGDDDDDDMQRAAYCGQHGDCFGGSCDCHDRFAGIACGEHAGFFFSLQLCGMF